MKKLILPQLVKKVPYSTQTSRLNKTAFKDYVLYYVINLMILSRTVGDPPH
jgi:hypothetical protein